MKKSFWKNSFKSIRGNISRFIAMLSIILLSSGVITGLLVSAPNMQMSMTEEYNKKNTADIQLISDLGFDNDSLDIVKSIDKSYLVEGVIIKDEQVLINNLVSVNILFYDLDLSNNNVNKLEVIEGNYPSNSNEILAERSSYFIEDIKVGDVITSNNKDYIVSGIVNNSWYFSKEAERAVSTSNPVKGIFYKNFEPNNDFYSNIFIHFDKLSSLNQFGNKYTKLVKEETLKIEQFKDRLLEDRLNSNLSIDTYNIYLLNRSSNISYQTYKTFINKVGRITQIFPIFFLLISVLVVLTTMTRMIEEERQEIGVLRALGYSKRTIYSKYLFYGLLVSIIGAGVGYAAGFRLIPSIIHDAFTSVFHLPPLNMDIFSLSNILYLLIIIVSILLTTTLAIRKTLKQNVSSLLIAKSPKYGKRIFLEKINFIWKRLKFKYKSSLRNLFRYPNHLIMTVIGIAGSLALIITGIGLINSISAITQIQYKELNQYDFSIDISSNDITFENYLNNNFDDNIYIYETSYMVTTKKTDESIYINVIVTNQDLSSFIKLRTRKKHQQLTLSNNGVIVSEQLANYMELKVGDIFEATKTDHLKIEGITENYLNNYVYMTKEYYETNFNDLISYNKILVKESDINIETINDKLFTFDNVLNTNFLTDEIIAKDRLLSQVSILAIVIVLAAIFLAIVVIYNLTNVNISEREKELSTLKVLGYKNTEVSSYIYREINIMTVLAVLIGTPLGVLLHRFVILSIEEPNMMMGRSIKWYSYIASIVLTILVTIGVELVMSIKIKKIDMIGALKEL